MPAHLTATVVITEGTDPDTIVEARCHPDPSGHIAALYIAGLTVQTAGDGTREMLALLDTARDHIDAEHRRWLAQCAAEASEAGASS